MRVCVYVQGCSQGVCRGVARVFAGVFAGGAKVQGCSQGGIAGVLQGVMSEPGILGDIGEEVNLLSQRGEDLTRAGLLARRI